MKIAMCEWPRSKGGAFEGPVIEEYPDGSILIAARVKGPRWIPGTHIRVRPEHIKGFAEQTVTSPVDRRRARRGQQP